MSVEGKFLSKEINDLLQPLPEVHNSLKVELSPIPTK